MHQRSSLVPNENRTLPNWIEWVIVLIIISISAVSLVYTYATGAFAISLTDSMHLSWYVVRSSGMVAYVLLAASMLWGLVITSRLFRNWSPGIVSLLLHATTSWLAVVLSAAHALILLFNDYYTYTLADVLVPFVGPYRPFAVGLGTLAFWLVLAITISFSLRRLIGQRSWLWLHYTSYGAFALISLHILWAGTDASQSAIRMILFGIVLSIFVLFGWRLIRGQIEREKNDMVH